MEKTKITNRQMCFLTFGVSLGGSVLVVSALMSSITKQDAWLGAIASAILGLPVIWILVFLGRRFLDKNYIETLQTVWGRWIGSVLSILSMSLWATLSYHIPWYVGDFMTSQSMPETPAYVIHLVFVAAVVIAVKYGLEAFSRAFEIFILISASLFLLAAVLTLPNTKIENLQPVLENGLSPVFKSAFFMSAFVTYTVYTLMMIYPTEADNLKAAGKCMLTGYLFSNAICFLSIILSTLVLGWQITANTRYPAFRLIQAERSQKNYPPFCFDCLCSVRRCFSGCFLPGKLDCLCVGTVCFFPWIRCSASYPNILLCQGRKEKIPAKITAWLRGYDSLCVLTGHTKHIKIGYAGAGD